MSLDDAIKNTASKTSPVLASTEFDGTEGFIQTGPLHSQPQTTSDFTDLLRQFGYDPETVEIVGPARISKWQQRPDSEFLSAYRFRIATRRECIDLPALYAAVEKTVQPEVSATGDGPVAVVVFADPQIGKTDARGGTPQLIERLEQKREALQEWITKIGPAKCVFVDAGDGVESFENTGSQPFTNDLSFPQQLDMYSTEVFKFVSVLCKSAPTTSLIVPSNHGAWRNGKQNLGNPQDDWGLFVHRQVAKQAQAIDMPLTCLMPEDYNESLVFDAGPATLGVTHGHQVGSPDRFPHWWAEQTHGGQPMATADVAITGHFHHLRVQPTGRNALSGRAKWWIQAPTLDNGSSWFVNRRGDESDPGMVVFTLNSEGFNLQSLEVL
ncbi:metallophosphoesterase [Gordonia phage GodonK]|uniref:Metallophosphoesterase n=1 Tax=Gordonia phage GodonK TaxID=2562192 RepID=A0A4D6E2G4_9CAUD|nr:metallophosphoesterase [Gordonia phage GodonK]QBZ72694.1 metallophosphoesterase [Gordonia phage GodonK]